VRWGPAMEYLFHKVCNPPWQPYIYMPRYVAHTVSLILRLTCFACHR
jgi:hypothetical protein